MTTVLGRAIGTLWRRNDRRLVQVVVTVGVSLAGALTVALIGTHGIGLAVLVLVALNIALLATRFVPAAAASTPLYAVAALVAAALMGVDRSGTSSFFAFFLAGRVGFTRPTRPALGVAVVTSIACTAATALANATGHSDTPWYLGALTGLAVFAGIANRNREPALRAAQDAASAAEQAARSEARASAMAERARIAREVHDVLAHSLAGVNMQLEVVDAQLEAGDTGSARESTDKAQRLVREGLAEISRTVHALRQDALPLVDTLTALVADAAPPGTELRVLGPHRDVPTPKASALARCAQEALTNAHKHAPGADVQITLTYAPEATRLDVVNARPARRSTNPHPGSGLGLVGMRERVALIGGTVQAGPVVEGADAGGWRVSVAVPA